MSKGPFDLAEKTGNFAIPAFGAFLTLALAAGGWEDTRSIRLVSAFAVFTLLSTFTAYCHRLAFLRQRKRQSESGEAPSNLSTGKIVLFLALHFTLILGLIWFVHEFVWRSVGTG